MSKMRKQFSPGNWVDLKLRCKIDSVTLFAGLEDSEKVCFPSSQGSIRRCGWRRSDRPTLPSLHTSDISDNESTSSFTSTQSTIIKSCVFYVTMRKSKQTIWCSTIAIRIAQRHFFIVSICRDHMISFSWKDSEKTNNFTESADTGLTILISPGYPTSHSR